MINYSINVNAVYRENEEIARITPDGLIEFVNDDAARFAPHVAKFLAENGRYDRETGQAVFILQGVTNSNPVGDPAPAGDPAGEESPGSDLERPELSTLADLISAVEACTQEKAPAMSPFWGNKTPEVLDYLKKHAVAIAHLKQACRFAGKLADMEF